MSIAYKINTENEKIKRAYLEWLKEAEGNCTGSVEDSEKTIHVLEDFLGHSDFKRFSPKRAKEFKAWLKDREYRGQRIKISTYVGYLWRLRRFFEWLSQKPGYKNSITSEVVSYLSPTRNEERAAKQTVLSDYPSLEHVVRLVNSITGDTEIDRRDRALISLAFLTGIRETALAKLSLGTFVEDRLCVRQEYRSGVETKMSKFIFSLVFPFDKGLQKRVLEWTAYLRAKGFGNSDPLFPRAKRFHRPKESLCYKPSCEIEPKFWKDGESVRNVVRKRAEEAKLKYYPPHAFRHSAARLALQACRTAEHLKVVGNSFGHEHIDTILRVYGNPLPDRMLEIRSEMDFSPKEKRSSGCEQGFI